MEFSGKILDRIIDRFPLVARRGVELAVKLGAASETAVASAR
jgi:hypothetical protein